MKKQRSANEVLKEKRAVTPVQESYWAIGGERDLLRSAFVKAGLDQAGVGGAVRVVKPSSPPRGDNSDPVEEFDVVINLDDLMGKVLKAAQQAFPGFVIEGPSKVPELELLAKRKK